MKCSVDLKIQTREELQGGYALSTLLNFEKKIILKYNC